ncbi:hypothetical protein N9233_00490 [Flavobacteriales bacterium]|nr:hypothetical protein [Flavobacteriales bacterium]
MEKYLSIPVTSAGNQLISCNGIISIVGTDATSVVITYKSGTTIDLTTTGAQNVMRNQIQDEVALALATGWTNVSRQVSPTNAISAVDVD